MTSFSSLTAQMSIDDLSIKEIKDEAIQRGGEHANAAWMDRALQVIRWICRNNPTFMSDDVQEVMAGYPERTSDGRAMGYAFRKAAKLGYCVKTKDSKPTRQKKSHGCERRIWRSLLYTL